MAHPLDQTSASGQGGTDSNSTRQSSETVEWQDLSQKPPTTGETTVEPSASVTGRIRDMSGESLTIKTEPVTVTLVGVPKVAIDDLLYAHHQPSANIETVRYAALFDIENTSDRPLHWLSRRTKFIGSDGYTYRRAHIDLNSANLAPGCHTNHVIIEPGCRARVITPVEQLPGDVEVSAVVHTVAIGDYPNHRLRFTL